MTDRQQFELADSTCGYGPGKPKKRGWLLVLAVNLLAAGCFMVAVLAVVGLWAHFA